MSDIYTFYLNSNDKQTGSTNNNAIFYINWDQLLKHDDSNDIRYKVNFNITVANGYYKDAAGTATTYTVFTQLYSSIKILANFQANSLSYDSSTKSQSIVLGYADRNIQAAASGTNSLTIGNGFSCSFGYNAPKIINKPTSNFLNIQLQDILGNSLCDTNTTGAKYTDCTPWVVILQLELV
jgi:hypothetical protein